MKKIINLRIVFMVIVIVLVIAGLGRINIINTKALSPLGETNDNYEKIKDELGEDFSSFIKDNAPIKIYNGDSQDTVVKAWNNDFTIRGESDIRSFASNIAGKIGTLFSKIKDKIDRIILG